LCATPTGKLVIDTCKGMAGESHLELFTLDMQIFGQLEDKRTAKGQINDNAIICLETVQSDYCVSFLIATVY
jgi:hypothetical protein